jgi:hypothetical protein
MSLTLCIGIISMHIILEQENWKEYKPSPGLPYIFLLCSNLSWNVVKKDKFINTSTPGIFLEGKGQPARKAYNLTAICEPTV